MQEKTRQYYLTRLNNTQQKLEKVRRDIYYFGTIRLLIVVCTVAAIWLFSSKGIFIYGSILITGIVLFLIALQKWNSLQKKKYYFETSATCDKNELDALDYRFDAFDGASERIQAMHPFSLDLDIFGNHSLFQSINRTSTVYGKLYLAGWFEKPEISPELILKRQKAIKELSSKPEFTHHFQVTGRMNQESASDSREIEKFVTQPAFIRHKKLWKTLRDVPSFGGA